MAAARPNSERAFKVLESRLQAALRDFETYGDGAADAIQRTQQLLAEIEEDLASS